jgi:hypothetical protein
MGHKSKKEAIEAMEREISKSTHLDDSFDFYREESEKLQMKFIKEQGDWLMTHTKLPVEEIVDFTEYSKRKVQPPK